MISSVAKFVEIFFLSRNISLSHTLQKYFSFTHTSEIFVELSRETFYKFSFYNTNDIPKSIMLWIFTPNLMTRSWRSLNGHDIT